jgi:hypothetical protein
MLTSVARDGEAKVKFSIIHPYFENTVTLPYHVSEWSRIPADQAEVIIVDDHSEVGKGPNIELLKSLKLPVRVFRVRSDILWNVTGARNIGAKHATNEKLILADFDYVVGAELIQHLQTLDYSDWNVVYWPMTRKPDTLKTLNRFHEAHCNSFVIDRLKFWEMGGYDEDFAGGWGFEDSHFHHTLGPRAGIRNVKLDVNAYFVWLDAGVHHPGTISVGRVNSDRNELLNLYKLKHPDDYRSKSVLRCNYELVYDSQARL